MHAIFECEFSKAVWDIVRAYYSPDEQRCDEQKLNYFGDLEWMDISLITAWAVWHNRNLELHEMVKRPANDIVEFIRDFLLEFQRCQSAVSIVAKSESSSRWQAPREGVIEVNFDGSFLASDHMASFGAVARDFEGAVMGSMAGNLKYIDSAFMAESLAALKAISWARDMGFTDIVLEGDALTIIKKANSSGQDISPVGPIVI
ncbi:hypothetical protein COLO4_09952 [Corchorus olitorius]|uniref:RNase H type-1 domain-containing protein n=1 Tax=Corchorus olitorius TaxID=93759 RepID=A0A1R3KAH4_9ROSI|nr:hypothetical protein COLO4_09952 [Corchorus olitorius]